MHAKRFAVFIWLTAALLFLSACNKSGPTSSSPPKTGLGHPEKDIKPVDFFGVDLRTATRAQLETLFYQTFKTPLVPRNDFESLATAGAIFPGAEKVEVITTQTGLLATMQFVFPGKNDPNLVLNVSQMMEARYGKPSVIHGRAEQGEYRVIWNRGDDFIIQVARGWPDTTTFLSFISGKHLIQLRGDMQNRAATTQNPKASAP